jgi:hypothetical protein
MRFSCDEQLAGFAELNFYLLEEISNWPFVVTDQNSYQLILTPFEYNIEGVIDPDTIKSTVNAKPTPDGIVYQIDISFRFITRSEALEQLLEQYQNKPGVAIGKMNSEFQKLYGTDLQPLYLTFEVDEGTDVVSKAFTEVHIKGETRQRPVYYTIKPVLF